MTIHTREEARRALETGFVDEAVAFWAAMTLTRSAGADDLLEHLRLLWTLYRLAEAERHEDALLAHPAAGPDHWLAAARELFARNRVRRSLRFTARAMAADPENADTAAIHAATLERAGDAEAAEALLRTTLERDAHHTRSVRLLAHLERLSGRTDEAIARLTHELSVRQTADDWRLRQELATALDRTGDAEGAMRELLAAKAQLATAAAPHWQPWREMTHRQWEVTRALDAARLARWAADCDDGPRPDICLLAGFPRSGTTLLETILAAHPRCVGTDESGILATHFRDPLVLQAASTEEALAELDSFGSEALSAGRAEYLRCTEEYLGQPVGDRLLVEKEPLLTADFAVPLRLFPAARVLMPLRDPRDVVLSYFFTLVPLGPSSVAAADLGETCRHYAEVMRHWLHLRGELNHHRWMEVRYEDLLAEPEDCTRRLAAFLGLEWTEAMLEPHQQLTGRFVSTPSYADVAQPMHRRSVGRWRRYHRWLEPHLHVLEPYLTAFGYD